jgi:hypothetical protein
MIFNQPFFIGERLIVVSELLLCFVRKRSFSPGSQPPVSWMVSKAARLSISTKQKSNS